MMQVVFCITHSSCRAESESEVAMMDDKKTCEEAMVDLGLGSEDGKR